MSTSQTNSVSQFNKTTFRTLYKDRSSKSLTKDKRKLSLKLGQHASLQKLQTKLDYLENK